MTVLGKFVRECGEIWGVILILSSVLIAGAYLELFVLGVWAERDALFLRWTLAYGWGVFPLCMSGLAIIGRMLR